jgi:hypothetical protein
MLNAKEKFLKHCETVAGMSSTDALKVYNYYKSNKILHLNGNHNTFYVAHGAFLEKETLLKASILAA